MDSPDISQILGFTREWFDLGLVTPEGLKKFEEEWNTGEDRNTEHYRWHAFLDFLVSKGSLDADTAKALYNLGSNEPDGAMGGSMMASILRRKECPIELLEIASKSKEKFLQKIANERLSAAS